MYICVAVQVHVVVKGLERYVIFRDKLKKTHSNRCFRVFCDESITPRFC